MRPGERDAADLWRRRLAEPQAPPSGALMLALAKLRLNAFCFGPEADAAKAPDWPLSPAQECAVSEAALARTGPERLRAVAGLLEASPLLSWFSSVESRVKAGVDPSDRYFRAFHRIDLAERTYCKPNVGIAGPTEANCEPCDPFADGIPGWSGRWPKALALDARGWAAVLWGSPRNLWRWWPIWELGLDEASADIEAGWAREGWSGPDCIQVGCGWVGTAMITLLCGFDGAGINKAAGRIFGLSPERTQWLGGAAGEAGPYWDQNLTGAHLAEVCREAAKGRHPKEVWGTLSEGVRRLRFYPDPYPPPLGRPGGRQ